MLQAGVIEGFFGRPWGWPARLSAVDFLSASGYQFYIYAPKAESFLRRRWREPMPPQTQALLSQLSARCRQAGVTFGIGLTPFEIYLDYDTSAQAALRSKVRQINEIGVPLLCVLFDDMRGDVKGLSEVQAKVVADVCAYSSAERFIICPTYYSYDSQLARVFGAAPESYLYDLGRLIDRRIDFFWTGEKVISTEYSAKHLARVAADIGRKPFIWDNHISNDSKMRSNHLYLDPAAGSWSLAAELAAGLAINPMNQPQLSRIALCGYQHLLLQSGRAQPQGLPEICRKLCGPKLAQRLLEDIDLLQNTGRAGLDADKHRDLLDWYGKETSNPCAQEIAAWLHGEYEFDPQCLTT